MVKQFAWVLALALAFSCSSRREKSEDAHGKMQDGTAVAKQTTQPEDSSSQRPPNGTYTFDVAFAEWREKSMGEKVSVIVNNDSVKVIYQGGDFLSAKEGEVIDEGILLKHEPSGKWIVADSKKDRHAKAVGGCSGGPAVIDFANKKYRTC